MDSLAAPAAITIRHREDLLYLLAEAAEVEHNLMCCYLYAAFGLKSGTAEGLTPEEAAAVARWRQVITRVAVEEMTHLALVGNLTVALGGRPHLGRPNFPVPPGYHPQDVVVRLAPFTLDTLDHFIFLERPEGSDVRDGAGFTAEAHYARGISGRGMMPNAQDYATVGELYRGLRAGLDRLAEAMPEGELFVFGADRQAGPADSPLPGLCVVTGLASARKALDTIVDQGEGAPGHREDSHFNRFQRIREEYLALLAANPSFAPSRPVATNPVMRRPLDPTGRVHVTDPLAAATLDLGNALYGEMLRLLSQAVGRADGDARARAAFLDGTTTLMRCLVPVAQALTTLPAGPEHPGVNAGLSFAMLRDVAALAEGPGEWALAAERTRELARAADCLSSRLPMAGDVAGRLRALADTLLATGASLRDRPVPATSPAGDLPRAAPVAGTLVDGAEVVRGRDITLRFDAKRCIHSRFCVLWQPHVYKANVVGAWIAPDADSAEASVAVAHNCPSGAITYDRHDGGPAEGAPAVNLVAVRENGPLAFRAPLRLDGAEIGFRATLCRCGASANKPYCDGSHAAAGFTASGEPATGDTTPLAARGGPLEVSPVRDGPLRVRGNLEVTSGTGRTVRKVEGALLCRCGQSADKPFCDGSHARVGFTADGC